MADQSPYPGAPRWVKLSGIVVAVLILLAAVVIALISAAHGPGRHMLSDSEIPATGDRP